MQLGWTTTLKFPHVPSGKHVVYIRVTEDYKNIANYGKDLSSPQRSSQIPTLSSPHGSISDDVAPMPLLAEISKDHQRHRDEQAYRSNQVYPQCGTVVGIVVGVVVAMMCRDTRWQERGGRSCETRVWSTSVESLVELLDLQEPDEGCDGLCS
jgi:hypothetical protein